jgi:hypothetical protein
MKSLVAGLALFLSISGAAYCQSSAPASSDGQVHPGTALLDRMGIFAGAPAAMPTSKAEADPADKGLSAPPTKPPSKLP